MQLFCARFFLLTCFLLAVSATAVAEPFQTIISNGSPQNRVDIAILGDGYTAAQLAQYQTDVQAFMASVFAQEPYREYQRYFNVHRIDVTSNQSGADHSDRNPPVFVDTALDAAYNCAAIQRLICVNTTKVNQVIGRTLPASYFDIILIIVNDPEYGGSGGSVAVASIDPSAVELILHEVGHSFGLLADEYTGGGPSCNPNVEPPEPNATRETVRALIKWNHWIDAATPIPTTSTTAAIPGLYVGSKYCDTGLYRPTFNNKMRNLGPPFEQINSEQHVKRVYSFVSPIDASSPAGPTVNITTAQSQLFTVAPPVPFTHTLTINWLVDGQQSGTGPSFTLAAGTLQPGAHTVRAVIADTTPFVRSDPQQLLSENRDWGVNVQLGRKPFDYDADGKTDVSVYRPGSTGTWYIQRSQAGFYGLEFGGGADKIVPADYDGDGKTDIAVYRPSEGMWYRFLSATQSFLASPWGAATDIPTPGDFDHDGRADIAIFRPSDGNWWLNRSTAGTLTTQFGQNLDVPVVGDYDGDGTSDIGVFRPANGLWFIRRSTAGDIGYLFGFGTDKVTPADYDGDGKTDIAVYRPATGQWFIVNSGSETYPIHQFGAPTDIPVPGDYDGDGRADVAIFRPSDGNWWIQRTTAGLTVFPFGQNGDRPTPYAFGN